MVLWWTGGLKVIQWYIESTGGLLQDVMLVGNTAQIQKDRQGDSEVNKS